MMTLNMMLGLVLQVISRVYFTFKRTFFLEAITGYVYVYGNAGMGFFQVSK